MSAISPGCPSPYVHIEPEEEYKALPLCDRMADVVKRIFNDIKFILTVMVPHFCIYFFARPEYYSHDWNWREENEGLFLFITGLNGHPVWAAAYGAELQSEHPEYEVRIPDVPNQGNCPLHEAALPFIEMVRDYIHKNPGKPINIISTSNGSRIAGYVESMLRGDRAAIRVGAIAGAYFGSELMDMLDDWGVGSLLFHEAILEDLKTGSENSKALIEAMRAPLFEGVVRQYQFYASHNDDRLSLSSSLPLLPGKEASYELYRGESHMSITDRVRKIELERSLTWMSSMRTAPEPAACA